MVELRLLFPSQSLAFCIKLFHKTFRGPTANEIKRFCFTTENVWKSKIFQTEQHQERKQENIWREKQMQIYFMVFYGYML